MIREPFKHYPNRGEACEAEESELYGLVEQTNSDKGTLIIQNCFYA